MGKGWDGIGPLPQAHRRVRHVSPELQEIARQFRREPTPAELRLWEALRGRRLHGLRWRFQHPVGTFVLDFYCPACKLVIEVDGSIHNLPAVLERDEERQRLLEAYGYRVLRFRNEQVETNLSQVLDEVAAAATLNPRTPPSPR